MPSMQSRELGQLRFSRSSGSLSGSVMCCSARVEEPTFYLGYGG
jgi:hypothetical protein